MGELLSVNQLSALTGRDRRTIDARLAGVPCQLGPKNAHLYDSALALAKIYVVDSDGKTLDQARTELASEQARTARIRGDEAERTRIPIDIVDALWDAAQQAAASALKAKRNKLLTPDAINDILAKWAEGQRPATW